MNRKLVLVVLAVVLSLALIGLPAGAQPERSVVGKMARVAPAGGIMTKARLQAVTGDATPLIAWRTAGTMAVAVEETGGGAVAGGRMYVPGGFTDPATPILYDKMQIYNGTAWTADAELMPGGPWGDAAICADGSGKIHVVNGVDGALIYAAHQVYDPAAPAGARWSFLNYPALADGSIYYSQASGCSFLGSAMYLYSGYAVVDPNPVAEATRVTWLWNSANDTWADTGKLMNTGRLWMAYANNTGKAFVAGGTNNFTTYAPTASVEAFTPGASGGWANYMPIPAAVGGGRLAGALATVGGSLVHYAGATYSTTGFTLQARTLFCGSCTPTKNWSDLRANIAVPRWFAAWAGGTVGSSRVLLAGGNDGSTTLRSAERLP